MLIRNMLTRRRVRNRAGCCLHAHREEGSVANDARRVQISDLAVSAILWHLA